MTTTGRDRLHQQCTKIRRSEIGCHLADPEQIEEVRDACLTDAFPNDLHGRNGTIITPLADTSLRVSELVVLDWDHVDLDADRPELYLRVGSRKGRSAMPISTSRTRPRVRSDATGTARGKRLMPCSRVGSPIV